MRTKRSTSTRKTRPGRCNAIVFLAGCLSGHPGGGWAQERSAAGARTLASVSGYCENLARKYSEKNTMDYQEHSASTERMSDLHIWASNMFQPPDSRFTGGFDCRFRARNRQGRVHGVSVSLFLTRTLPFARHTQWKELQIIPIGHVVDETHDRAGYRVFKHLKQD